jgi:hypothetical protein
VNTEIVDVRTLSAVLAMEAALALPIISLPTQGDRLTGLAGPLLLVLLLPVGFAGVYTFASLRDPSWRLLAGIGLALLTRAIVSNVPDQGLAGLTVWLGRSVVPAAIGVGLWWRGGALAVAETTPADVRSEFSVVAVCLIVVLAMMRPLLLPDRVLLGASVGLFVVAGLVGTALSRQDGAAIAAARLGQTLAMAVSLLPAAAGVLLVGSLRPELLSTFWLLIARAIELALTPIGLLLGWLASLLPGPTAGRPPAPLPLPTPEPLDPAALAAAREHLAWIITAILVTLLVAAGLGALLAARLLLSNYIRDPHSGAERRQHDELVVEISGTPRDDAADLVAWILRWLRAQLSRKRPALRLAAAADVRGAHTAWAAYQRLLAWADRQGVGRRPAETTGQLEMRLAQQLPEAAEAIDLVTRTFEWERYGAVPPTSDRLRSVQQALDALAKRGVSPPAGRPGSRHPTAD